MGNQLPNKSNEGRHRSGLFKVECFSEDRTFKQFMAGLLLDNHGSRLRTDVHHSGKLVIVIGLNNSASIIRQGLRTITTLYIGINMFIGP